MKSHLLFRFSLYHLILFFCMRLVFFVTFIGDSNYAASELVQAFFLGSRFDLRLVMFLTLPLIFFSWGRWSPSVSRKAGYWWSLVYALLAHVWLFFYFLDFGYFGYLGTRVNSSVLAFLGNLDIAYGMVRDSYPVTWMLVGFFVFVIAYFWALKKYLFVEQDRPWEPRWMVRGRAILFFFILAVGIHGRVGQYPLRWSEAFFTPKPFISYLSLNPLLYFFDTMKYTEKKGFDTAKAREGYSQVAKHLGVLEPNAETLNYERPVAAKQNKKYNVVVIVMESLALSKTNLMDNPLDATPYLEKLAKENYWFSNYYSPSEGTARNMFSIMTSIPDVTKVKTSSRNPLVVNQDLIVNAFSGHDKYYFLGGSASWANIRGIFSHNISDIQIKEEGDFEAKTMDVWGISDLHLFIEAHKTFKQWRKKDKPFVAVIQAASFHRPYDIPEDALKKGFKVEAHDLDTLKKAGFYSLEQYNSLKFTDYSLGYFFQLAQSSPYFEDTLFIVTGDHGLPSDRGVNVSQGREELYIEKYHVPLVLVNKSLFPEPKVDDRPAGHPDIMTTAAHLAGVEHVNKTLGRNLFDPSYDNSRYAFMYNYYSEVSEYNLIDKKYLYRYDSVKQGQLYEFDSEDPLKNLKDEKPEEYTRMKTLAESLYETSRYMLYNNKKEPSAKKAL